MKFIVAVLLLVFALPNGLHSAQETQAKRKITVNNRVLASVNGKVISVVDVMKKMDMLLYQMYPHYLEVPQARYEFYNAHWREVLSDLIDRELVIADAEEKNFPVSSGDVREELEAIFGPNVMINLDNAGLTSDDAWQMVKADILIRRMLYLQVRSHIYAQITPTEVRKAYDEYIKDKTGQTECVWQCLTLKSKDTNAAMKHAEKLRMILVDEKVPIESLEAELEKRGLKAGDIQMTLSQAFSQKQNELSPALQELLLKMDPGTYSLPQLQTSRAEQNPVVRLYYVIEIKQDKIPTVQELDAQLREELTQKMSEVKTAEYFGGLRRHFHLSKEQIEKDLPPDFRPFTLS